MSPLTEMPLVEALWWFIENADGEFDDTRNNLFFELRERYRTEHQTAAMPITPPVPEPVLALGPLPAWTDGWGAGWKIGRGA